jgi:acylphosphatase
MAVRRTVIFRGTVQGVGFRWTAMRVAAGFDVTGTVCNRDDGAVELVAEGDAMEIAAMLGALRERMGGYIRDMSSRDGPATGEFEGFSVSR